jgi:hypothetical protein
MIDKRLQTSKDIINKMMEIAGYDVTFDDLVKEEDGWYARYTMTQKQNDEWREWSMNKLMKDRGMTKRKAEYEMSMMDLAYGLRIDEDGFRSLPEISENGNEQI